MIRRSRNSFIQIDLKALRSNLEALSLSFSGKLNPTQIIPMVKADGYGHGDVKVAKLYEKMGVPFLGVALIEEGVKLRESGIRQNILTFCPFNSEGAEVILKYNLTPVISTMVELESLCQFLHDPVTCPIHVKFNTGMQRLGFEPEECKDLINALKAQKNIILEGVCTHFASSDDFNNEESFTKKQLEKFLPVVDQIKREISSEVKVHALNSGGIISGVTPKFDYARPGISLYGYVPSNSRQTPMSAWRDKLKPALSLHSEVAYIKKIKPGTGVSYSSTWKSSETSTIVVVPLGYADGLPRLLSNKGKVLINDVMCPIRGVVCMDYFMAEVPGGKVKVGDEVVLIGKRGLNQITAEEIGETVGTISYEILTGMQSRLPRIYLD